MATQLPYANVNIPKGKNNIPKIQIRIPNISSSIQQNKMMNLTNSQSNNSISSSGSGSDSQHSLNSCYMTLEKVQLPTLKMDTSKTAKHQTPHNSNVLQSNYDNQHKTSGMIQDKVHDDVTHQTHNILTNVKTSTPLASTTNNFKNTSPPALNNFKNTSQPALNNFNNVAIPKSQQATTKVKIPNVTSPKVTVPNGTLPKVTVATVTRPHLPKVMVPIVTVPNATVTTVGVPNATVPKVTVPVSPTPGVTVFKTTVPKDNVNAEKKDIKKYLVDDRCPIGGEIVAMYNDYYTCSLTQTEIAFNMNKFYIMQLVKSGNQYNLFVVYGRNGEKGTISTKPFETLSEGASAFQKQFKSKTGNDWNHRENFIKKRGKYFMNEINYDDVENVDIPEIQNEECSMDSRLEYLIKLLSDTALMQKAIVSLDIDIEKMPLGKLKDTQLDKAVEILNKIENNKDVQNLVDLSSEFYTYVPMSFGRKSPPVIDNALAQKYREIIDELRNIVFTVNIKNNASRGKNNIQSIYEGINTDITPLEHNDPIYKEIVKYVENTHGQTHHCKLKIVDIFAVEQKGKKVKYENATKNINNKTLLFHGSAVTNWMSILKNDLIINPETIKKNVQITGKMFGDGIYFANCVSKSWNYCRSETSNGIGCLALAEVALGKIDNKLNSDCYITYNSLKQKGYDSVQGIGKNSPSGNAIVDGTKIPNGQLLKTNISGSSLLYDEFIVYKSEQQLIKYLVLVTDK